MDSTIKFYASDGKPYDTAKEAIQASLALPTPAQTVLKLINETVFNLEGDTKHG